MCMKAIYVCVISLCFISLPVFAQEDHHPPNAEEIVARMQSKLNLTQDQATAIITIFKKYAAKHQEIRQGVKDGTIDRDSLKSQLQQLKADEDQELSQIITPDQLSQWNSMQSKHRHKEGGEGSGGDNPPPQQ